MKNMDSGGVFPQPNQAEHARQRYAEGLRQYLFGPFAQSVREEFYSTIAPAYQAEHGEPLTDRRAARKEALKSTRYQIFSDLHRIAQDLIWNSVADTVERSEETLSKGYQEIPLPKKGSIKLDPELEVPRYLSAVDIHCMPGSYHRSTGDADLNTGALYHRGAFHYAPGSGPALEALGRTGLKYLKDNFPELRPRRILDMGCATGGPTGVYAEAFPEAELHAIDIGASLLRFGHLEAESKGKAIHFSQQNAEQTTFEDGSFDLVVSHIMFHETSAKALQPILNESKRLLAPGGVMMHLDLPSPDVLPDIFTKVIFDGDAYYNNEPFWMRMHEHDWLALMQAAGFASDRCRTDTIRGMTFVPPSDGASEGSWAEGFLPLTAFVGEA